MICAHVFEVCDLCACFEVCDFVNFNSTSVACAVGSSVTMSSTDFSFQNLVFWNLFEFSAAEMT